MTRINELHEAIGRWLVTKLQTLTVTEVRYLRTHIGISQDELNFLVEFKDRTRHSFRNARHVVVVDMFYDRMVGALWLEHAELDPTLRTLLSQDLTKYDDRNIDGDFGIVEGRWQMVRTLRAGESA